MTNAAFMFWISVGIPVAVADAAPFKEFHQVIPIEPSGLVTLRTFKGSVDLKTAATAEVRVDARIEAEPDCGTAQEQQDRVNKTEISVAQSAHSVRIASDYSKINEAEWNDGCQSRPLVNYQIVVPATVSLSVRDHKSVVKVDDLRGHLSLKTHKGNVNISNLGGGLELETHKGEAKVAFGRLAEKSSIASFKGNVEIIVPRKTGFTLNAELGRRAALESNLFKSEARDSSQRKYRQTLSAEVNGGGPILRLSSQKGHFRLHEA